MSSLVNPTRIRAPRTAGAAIERARLALVPTRRTNAPRAPFAVLVFVILGAGVVGLLMFNTHMQQASFYATSLQKRADALAAERQNLEREVADISSPQSLGVAGRKLGMVAPPNPADLNLATGKIEGDPLVATPDNKVPVNAPPVEKPRSINLPPLHQKVYAGGAVPPGTKTPTTPTKNSKNATSGKAAKNSGHSKTGHGPASP